MQFITYEGFFIIVYVFKDVRIFFYYRSVSPPEVILVTKEVLCLSFLTRMNPSNRLFISVQTTTINGRVRKNKLFIGWKKNVTDVG